jgi:hypothetical protein
MTKSTEDMLAEKSHTDCIMDLMQFLVIAEHEGDMYGMVTATQALESVQTLFGYDDDKFEKLKDIFRM